MGNAPDEVKKCATYVTLDNDNEGVLFGINQLQVLKVDYIGRDFYTISKI